MLDPSSTSLDLHAFAVEHLRPEERVLWVGRPDPGQSAWYGFRGADSAWSALGGLMLLAPLDLLMLIGTRQLFPSVEWVSQNAVLWLLTVIVSVNSRLGVWRARRTHYVITDERVFFVVGQRVRRWIERARLERVSIHEYDAGAGTLRLWQRCYDTETGRNDFDTAVLIGIADVRSVATLLQPSASARPQLEQQTAAQQAVATAPPLDWLGELDHPSFRVRKLAAQRFATLVRNREMALELLSAALRDANVLARIQLVDVSACEALELAAAQEICRGLRATEPAQRARAAAALRGLSRALEQPAQAEAGALAVRILSRGDDVLVPTLVELLAHPDACVRQRVLSVLGALGSTASPARAALEALLEDHDHEVVEAAAVLLVELGTPSERAVSRLIVGLARSQPVQRAKLMAALHAAGGAALPALRQALGAANADVVAGAASVLGHAGERAALPALLRVLQHRSAAARQAAAEAIGRIVATTGQVLEPPGSYEAASALVKALSDPQEAVSRSAASALQSVARGEHAALVPAVLSALARPAPWVACTLSSFGEPAVAALLDGLQHRDKRVRLGAIDALGQLGAAGSLNTTAPLVAAALVDALARAGAQSAAAAKALEQLGDAAQSALQAALGSAEPSLRRSVVSLVFKPGAGAALEAAMLVALNDADVGVQLSAARGLRDSAAQREAVLHTIERALRDPDPQQRCGALCLLCELPDFSSPEAPLDALRDPSPRVREAAAQALFQLRTPRAVSPLIAAVSEADPRVAAAAARALGVSAAGLAQTAQLDRAIAGLVQLFERGDAACRDESLRALASLGEAAVPGLVHALTHGAEHVRLGATDALAALGPRAAAAVPALLLQLGSEHARERASAARALGAIGQLPQLVVPRLAEQLHDRVVYVRDAVLHALFLYGPLAACAVPQLLAELERDSGPDAERIASCLALIGPAALPALIRALSHPGERTRIRAAKALSLFGAQADPALAALIMALDSPAVRPYAAAALRSLSDAAKAQIPLRWTCEVARVEAATQEQRSS